MVKKYSELRACIHQFDNDANSRFLSYDHCRSFFMNNLSNEEKRDEIALYLYAYLASWGMLRNSSLLYKDYLFLRPVVDIICKAEYRELLKFDVNDCDKEIIAEKITNISNEIKTYFEGQHFFKGLATEEEPIDDVTDTRLTKILLGTFGCIPAFDNYFKKGISVEPELKGVTFNKKSIVRLIEFAAKNINDINRYKKENGLSDLYTPMKILDMWFWEYGYRLSLNK